MNPEDVLRKFAKTFSLTRNDNVHEALQALRTAQSLVESHMKGDLLSFLNVPSSDYSADDLSVDELMKIADYQDIEIQRLEDENAELRRDLQKAKAENNRLRRETRLIQSLAPEEAAAAAYREKLEKWCRKFVLIDEDEWVGTKEIQDEFEKKHPGLRKYEITLNRFSRLFREITGEESIVGGPLGKNRGFPVSIRAR